MSCNFEVTGGRVVLISSLIRLVVFNNRVMSCHFEVISGRVMLLSAGLIRLVVFDNHITIMSSRGYKWSRRVDFKFLQ